MRRKIAFITLFIIISTAVIAAINTNLPWHSLQQVSTDNSGLTSVDENGNGIIDYVDEAFGVTDDSIQSDDIEDGSINASDINTTQVQIRIIGNCPAGQSIREINEDGTVTCETDDTGASFWQPNGFDIYYTLGRVGIGTTTPSTNLEVVGDSVFSGDVDVIGGMEVTGDSLFSGDVDVSGGIRINSGSSRPACTASLRGTMWFQEGASGVEDTFSVCRKLADNTYEWNEGVVPVTLEGYWAPVTDPDEMHTPPEDYCETTTFQPCADSSGYTCKSGSHYGDSIDYGDIGMMDDGWRCDGYGYQITQIHCCDPSDPPDVTFQSEFWAPVTNPDDLHTPPEVYCIGSSIICADSSGYTCKSGSHYGDSIDYGDIGMMDDGWRCDGYGHQLSQIHCCQP